MSFFKKNSQRGEIATTLTVAAFVLMMFGVYIGTRTNGPTSQFTRADTAPVPTLPPLSDGRAVPGFDFRGSSGVCRAQIIYGRDPIIYQIEIRDKASGNVFIINDKTPTIPLKGDGNFKRGSQFDPGSGSTVVWGPPDHADEIYVLVDNGRKHNTEHYYYRPAWLGLNDVDVVFYYDRILGPRNNPREIKQAYQVVVGKKGCFPNVTPTINPSVTPTVTPTINPSVTPTITPTINPSVTPTVTPTCTPDQTGRCPRTTPTPTPNACPATGTISGHIEITGQLPSQCGVNGANCKFQVRVCKPNPRDGGQTIECRPSQCVGTQCGAEYPLPAPVARQFTSTGPGFTYSVSGVPTSEDVGVFVERRLFSAAGVDLRDLPWNQTALNCSAPRGTRRWLSDCFVRLDKEVPACSATNVNFRIPFPGPSVTPTPTIISCPNNKGTITTKIEVVGSLPAKCNDTNIFPDGCYFTVYACKKVGNIANCDRNNGGDYYDSASAPANGTVTLRNIPADQVVGLFVDQVLYTKNGTSKDTFNNDYIESLRCTAPKSRPLHKRDCFLQLTKAPACDETQDFRITFPNVSPTVTPTVIPSATPTPSPTTPPVCYKDCRSTIDCGRDQLCDFIVQCPPGSAPNCVEKGKCVYPKDLTRTTCDNVTPTVTPVPGDCNQSCINGCAAGLSCYTPSYCPVGAKDCGYCTGARCTNTPRIKGQIVVKSCIQPDHDVLVDICEQDAAGRLASANCTGPSQEIHLKPAPQDNAVWFTSKVGDVYTYDYLMTEGPSSKPLVSGGYYNLPFSMAQIQNPTNGVIDRLSNERNQQVTLPLGDTVINWTIDMSAETCPTVTPSVTPSVAPSASPTPGVCRWEATSMIKERMSNGALRFMDEIDQDNVQYFNMNNKQRDRHGDGILPPAPEAYGYRFKDGINYALIEKAESAFWPVVVASNDSRGVVYQYTRGEDACVKLYYDKSTYDIVGHEVPALTIDGKDIKRQPFVNPSNNQEICGLPFACNLSYKYGWILQRKPNVPTPTGGSCPLQVDECTPRNFVVDEVKEQTTNVEWQAPRACPQFTPGRGNSVYWILVREGANGPIVSSRGPIGDEDTGIKARDNYLSQVQKPITSWQPGITYYASVYAYQEGSAPECKSPPAVVTFKRDEENQPTSTPTPRPVDDIKVQQLDWVLNGKGICWAGWAAGSCALSRNGSDAWCESSADNRFKCKAPDGQVNGGYVTQIMLKANQNPITLNFKSVVCSACHSTPAPDAKPQYNVAYCETGVHGDARENAVGEYTLQPGKCYQLERSDNSGNNIRVKEIDCGNAGFNNSCRNTQPGGPNQSQATSGTLPMSFMIKNNSNKAIDAVEITACETNGGCSTIKRDVSVASGATTNVTSEFTQVNKKTVSVNTRYNISCKLLYTDGTTQACPQKELGANNPVEYDLTVDTRGTLGSSITTERQRVDCDNDGVPSALDLAQLYANTENNSCDPSRSGGSVNALDFSLAFKWLGESRD